MKLSWLRPAAGRASSTPTGFLLTTTRAAASPPDPPLSCELSHRLGLGCRLACRPARGNKAPYRAERRRHRHQPRDLRRNLRRHLLWARPEAGRTSIPPIPPRCTGPPTAPPDPST